MCQVHGCQHERDEGGVRLLLRSTGCAHPGAREHHHVDHQTAAGEAPQQPWCYEAESDVADKRRREQMRATQRVRVAPRRQLAELAVLEVLALGESRERRHDHRPAAQAACRR